MYSLFVYEIFPVKLDRMLYVHMTWNMYFVQCFIRNSYIAGSRHEICVMWKYLFLFSSHMIKLHDILWVINEVSNLLKKHSYHLLVKWYKTCYTNAVSLLAVKTKSIQELMPVWYSCMATSSTSLTLFCCCS